MTYWGPDKRLDILDKLDVGIIEVELRSRRLCHSNRAATEILGNDDEISYERLCELFYLEQGIAESSVDDQRMIRHAGRLIGYSFYPGPGEIVWIIFRDVTERFRLRKIAEEVALLNNISYAFHGIAHELGNPVNSMKVALQVLQRNLDTFAKEDIKVYVDQVVNEIARIEWILRSLRTFNTLEDLQLQPVDMKGFVTSFSRVVAKDVESRGVNAQFHCLGDDLLVVGDPSALQQALINVFSNAIDALVDRNEPTLTMDVVGLDDTRVLIRVTDNGCGIAEAQKAELFMPFASTKRRGTGLGLVIVKKLVTGMKGTIEISSVEGDGTTVEIVLPRRVARDG
jgi:signal transduction histidine kinase